MEHDSNMVYIYIYIYIYIYECIHTLVGALLPNNNTTKVLTHRRCQILDPYITTLQMERTMLTNTMVVTPRECIHVK